MKEKVRELQSESAEVSERTGFQSIFSFGFEPSGEAVFRRIEKSMKRSEEIQNRADLPRIRIVSEIVQRFQEERNGFFGISLLSISPTNPVKRFAYPGLSSVAAFDVVRKKGDHFIEILLRAKDFSLLKETVKIEVLHLGWDFSEHAQCFVEPGSAHLDIAEKDETFAEARMMWEIVDKLRCCDRRSFVIAHRVQSCGATVRDFAFEPM